MLHKKSIKILSVFVAVIIAFSCFCLSVSAETFNLSFDGLNLTDVNISVIDETGNFVEGVEISAWIVSDDLISNSVCFGISKKSGNFSEGNYSLVLQFIADEYLVNSQNYCIGGYSVYAFNSVCKFRNDLLYFSRRSSSDLYNDFQNANCTVSTEMIQGNAMAKFRVDYSKNELGTKYDVYRTNISFTMKGTTTAFRIYLGDFDLRLVSPEEAAADSIKENQDKNTDKILNAGSDVEQPDFNSANGQLDDTTAQMESIEGQYKIDEAATQDALAGGSNFLKGSDMQKASVQVKTWIEDFSSDNSVYTGFLVAAMCLGLCFWVIGRKAGSG